MLAVPNCQKVNGWSCSSQLWHPHRLGYDCLFNSCRMTAHTLVGVQNQRWTVLIKLSWHGHRLLIRNTVTWQPITGGRQHRTPATLHKPFHEEPGRMLSRGRQSTCRCLWHTPMISQKLAGECNLVCSATAMTKTALSIIQLWFNHFAAFFSRRLTMWMLIIWKSSISIAGHTKSPRGPHAARVLEPPGIEYGSRDSNYPSRSLTTMVNSFDLMLLGRPQTPKPEYNGLLLACCRWPTTGKRTSAKLSQLFLARPNHTPFWGQLNKGRHRWHNLLMVSWKFFG